MKSIWNKKHPDAKIVSNNPKTIWENLRYIFKNTCSKESCWLRHKCLNEDISMDVKKILLHQRLQKNGKKNLMNGCLV